MSFQTKIVDGVWYIGVDGASMICGVSDVTFRKWRESPDPPPFNDEIKMAPLKELGDWVGKSRMFKTGSGGGFPYLPDKKRLAAVIMPDRAPSVDPNAEDDLIDFNKARARTEKLRGDMLQHDLSVKMGEYVSAEETAEAWTQIITLTKTRLLGIPTAVAPEITGETDPFRIEEVIMSEIRTVLEELASGADDDYDDDDDGAE